MPDMPIGKGRFDSEVVDADPNGQGCNDNTLICFWIKYDLRDMFFANHETSGNSITETHCTHDDVCEFRAPLYAGGPRDRGSLKPVHWPYSILV